jgi:chromate reductase
MTQYQIAVIVGSLRRDSINRQLAYGLIQLAPAEFSFKLLEIGDVPLYNQDNDETPAVSVTQLKGEIAAASGLLFVTPEYNRSIPGVLKNVLDHASRPHGKNAWAGKPAGIVGASLGTIGTAVAQQHLRTILAYLDVPTLGQPEAYLQIRDGFLNDAAAVANESTRKFLQGWMDRFVAWVKLHAA